MADAPAQTPKPRTVLDKNEVLTGLFACWDSIEALLTALPDDAWQAPTSLPGWTVHDVVAHIIGTEAMLAGEPNPEPETDVTTRDHVRNDIGAFNERWVEHLRGESPASMMARYRELTTRRKAALSAMSPEEWNTVGFTPAGPDSHGRFMRVRIFDCWMHEQDVRAAVGRPPADDDLAGPDVRLALDEMAASMGFVVGKKGQAPAGARVLLKLTGPITREIRVAVNPEDGRAAVVDGFGGAEPTIAIAMDGLQFTRLAGGRPMFEDRSTDIHYAGDAAAGERIVDNLAYVI